MRDWADPEKPWQRKTCKPLGPQGILYGDKVINLVNGRRRDIYPANDSAYLANGEIGLVVGQFKGSKWKTEEASLEDRSRVLFAARHEVWLRGQRFWPGARSIAGLAYALTIPKAQGSEFGTTFVVVPNPCRLLSRELLYSALTRQTEEVVLLHQGDVRALMKLSSAEHSETARRLTNLFTDPRPVEHLGFFLEDGLIHRTARGEFVRSKSEVIIANLLHTLGAAYAYEQPFIGLDGSVRYPDFTIDDAETWQAGPPRTPRYDGGTGLQISGATKACLVPRAGGEARRGR